MTIREFIDQAFFYLLLISIFGAICVICCDSDDGYHIESEYWDLYYVEAPFGYMWVETRGAFVFGCGRISSELHESYIIKYFDGDELLSKTMFAEETAVVVDETFRLEKELTYNKVKNLWRPMYIEKNPIRERYIIHIPYLPEIDQRWGGEYP